MSDEPLYTLRELADQLDLPESTVRYYRDAFLDHIPSVGTGRRRRYPPAALAVLRSIANGYATGLPRNEVLRQVDGAAPASEPVRRAPPHAQKSGRRPPVAETTEVTNLDLLAAIVDGEREQREALWQMAQEVLRLTQVLENQEKVLTEISDHTGTSLRAPEPQPVLPSPFSRPPALGDGGQDATATLAMSAPASQPSAPAFPSLSTAPPPPPPEAAMPPWLQDLAPPPAGIVSFAETPEPPPAERSAPPAFPGTDIERLRQELESERALVDRLREAKLKLEQRTADAEGALADQKGRRRLSMLGRLLKTDRDGE